MPARPPFRRFWTRYPRLGCRFLMGGPSPRVITVSVDEKPAVQAIANVAVDLPPVPGRYPRGARDHEYKRLGTCSILAALDLHDGRVTARVERRHRSREFILLLKDLDQSYPAKCTIRLILDNHSSHLSKETKDYLATRPNRFQYVHTPTHGSWLNIVETLFGKMARTFLKRIRVESWEELRERILLGIAEINAAPVVHRWSKFEAVEGSDSATNIFGKSKHLISECFGVACWYEQIRIRCPLLTGSAF